MPRWLIDGPEQLTFDGVRQLNVRIVAGRLAVLASDGPPTLEVSEIGATPIVVEYDKESGTLTVAYEDLTWDGVLNWLRPGSRHSVVTLTVPKDCEVHAGVVSASAIVAGLEARTRVKSVAGDIALDGVSGEISAETVSGAVESRGMAGDLTFTSVSGELVLAHGTPRRLRANTVSGPITADLKLRPTGHVTLNSISGPVRVRLPRDVDTDVVLRSTSGKIDAAFPQLSGTGRPGARSLKGRIGDGMASVTATTVSGSISLLSKDLA